MPPEETPNKQRLSLDLRIVVVALLLIIGVMIIIWKPWDSIDPNDRTISVTGEATISAEPDEYTFAPTYEFTSANKDTALENLLKKNDQIIQELKGLGVEDNQIKNNARDQDYLVQRKPGTQAFTYALIPTITIDNKELAQKVQDYLLTTSPSGEITPQVTFSDTKEKELENKARDQATKDARAKAEQSAKNLGFSVGKVKEVSDGAGFGGAIPLRSGTEPAIAEDSSLTIQPGENELEYSVTVTYYVD